CLYQSHLLLLFQQLPHCSRPQKNRLWTARMVEATSPSPKAACAQISGEDLFAM
ncbi:hypothetical protein NDU88_005214, partial [Pleurodeles waltl]